ncbi:MAG: inactive transglutaminase family protein [Gammaproteobacteria bacterium]|nr:inactive transglutaminase family protein [Gammaproteobacteria bacterium]
MKNNKQHTYILISVLLMLGCGIFCYRHWMLDVPLTQSQTVNSWMVEANLKFMAQKNTPIKARFTIPYTPPNMAILDEYFVSHHYGVMTNIEGLNRQIIWSLRRGKGLQSLYYRVILQETQSDDLHLPKPKLTKPAALSDNQNTAIETIISQSRETSADIQTFTQGVIKQLNEHSGNVKLLLNGSRDDAHLVQAILLVLNQANISGMAIQTIHLSDQKRTDFKWVLAVYTGSTWMMFDPHTGATGIPARVLIWQYGQSPLFEVAGGYHPTFNVTVSPTPGNALSIAKLRGLQTDSDLLRFSLLQLPVTTQETYKILLTVPIGAFIILLLRNFIGLKTFGTFMPVLIALAFRETRVIWGLSLFTIIVSIGLLARFYFAQLRLLLIPRLSAILTVVILLMIAISVLSQNLGLSRGLSVSLFPMVILTMTIERMCITWDERGPSEALKSGLGSLLAALIAYAAMSNTEIEYLMFAFPELLFVVLALILWFGQYRGYRLLELLRFKSLIKRS